MSNERYIAILPLKPSLEPSLEIPLKPRVAVVFRAPIVNVSKNCSNFACLRAGLKRPFKDRKP